MTDSSKDHIIETFKQQLASTSFPCVAARAAVNNGQVQVMMAGHMGCPRSDGSILEFIYAFVDHFRQADKGFHSVAIIFEQPQNITAAAFDQLLWMRLQALANLDAQNYTYDSRVNKSPLASDFSFSLKKEAFFVVGLHPGSERASRHFDYPVIVFNPHVQFENLRQQNQIEKLKTIVRKKDVLYSGSINPLLQDFGTQSEVFQYSGLAHDEQWECPLKLNHESTTHYSST